MLAQERRRDPEAERYRDSAAATRRRCPLLHHAGAAQDPAVSADSIDRVPHGRLGHFQAGPRAEDRQPHDIHRGLPPEHPELAREPRTW